MPKSISARSDDSGLRPRSYSQSTLRSLALNDITTMKAIVEEVTEITEEQAGIELDERKSSWKSLWVCNIIQLLCGLQLSIYFTSMWPYLQSVDPSCNVSFLGWIIASYSAGQAVASPIFGVWFQKTNVARFPITLGLFLSAAGHCVYALLPSIDVSSRWMMLGSRILVGLGSGNLSVLRSYTATASVPRDRQRAMASAIASYVLGMTIGPVVQGAFAPIGSTGFHIGSVQFNMYTVPAYTMVLVNLIAPIFLFTIFVEEYSGIITEEELTSDNIVVPKFDRLAACGIIYLWYVQQTISTNIEVMSSPISITLYNWSDTESVVYNGIIQFCACIMSVSNYVAIGYTRVGKIDRRIQILFGIIVFALFYSILMPWPFYTKYLHYKPNSTLNHANSLINMDWEKGTGGCQDNYHWCTKTKRVPLALYIFGCVVCFGMAFPYMTNSLGTLYSEVLGPRKQGTMQGILALFGSTARCLGPLWSTILFSVSGYKWMSALTLLHLAIALAVHLLLWRRMVPLEIIKLDKVDEIVYNTDEFNDGPRSSIEKPKLNGTDNPVFIIEKPQIVENNKLEKVLEGVEPEPESDEDEDEKF